MFGAAISAGINFEKFDNIQVKVSGEGNFPPIKSFAESVLRELLLENVKRSGYTKPNSKACHSNHLCQAGFNGLCSNRIRYEKLISQNSKYFFYQNIIQEKLPLSFYRYLNNIMRDNHDLIHRNIHCLVMAPTRYLFDYC
jgi:hypothetical protein